MTFKKWLIVVAVVAISARIVESASADGGVQVGAARVDMDATDSMTIGGSIGPGTVMGQEGKLSAVAVVLRHKNGTRLAIVACDVLMLTRDLLDSAVAEIEKSCGIPAAQILINATHTHHAPSTVTVHGYKRDEAFSQIARQAIVTAVERANRDLSKDDCRFLFQLGEEKTVGKNSRLLLSDNTIYWIGPHDDEVRPTGPFDPQLPVLAFRDPADKLRAVIFNHSTHTIGTLKPGVRSPSFYGLAAQELEAKWGCPVSFLEGASGSTHNLDLKADEAMRRIGLAVEATLADASERPVNRLGGLKRSFRFKVRDFDDATEDVIVTKYCEKRAPSYSKQIIEVFRNQRAVLLPQRGQQRETWIQAIVIGDIALVGVPAEFFTQLGVDIKQRSPFKHTFVAELANDWIGYLPNREAHELGGYQTWTGLHSYAEPGTGERMVDETVNLLKELEGQK